MGLYRRAAADFERRQELEPAIAACRRLLELAPGDPEAVTRLALLETRQERAHLRPELPLRPPTDGPLRPPGVRGSRRETIRGVVPPGSQSRPITAQPRPDDRWAATASRRFASRPGPGDSDDNITSPRLELVADLPDGVEDTQDREIEPTFERRPEGTEPAATSPSAEAGASGSLGTAAAVVDGSGPRDAPGTEATEPSSLLEPEAPAEPEPGESQRDLLVAFDRPSADMFRPRARRPTFIERSLRLFPGMPEEAVDELVAHVVQRRFEAGEIILREGEPGDACFLLTAGSARVFKRDPLAPTGDLIEVTRLEEGQLFGEFAVLADRRRHATVQADGAVRAIEIPRRLLLRLTESYPEMTPILEHYLRERMLANLVATAPFLRKIDEPRRSELLAEFVPMKVAAGGMIVRQGERGGGFYLVVLGGVEISKEVSGDRDVLLATLGEGDYFGVLSLLRGDVARAKVSALGPTELAMLPPQSFYDLVAELPVLWDEVRREANRRELEMYELVAGVTGTV